MNCKKYDVVTHSEDEKPLDCKIEKKPLEKPLTEDINPNTVDLKDFETALKTPGVWGVKEVGDDSDDLALFATEKEARECFKRLLLDDLLVEDYDTIELFVVDANGKTETIDVVDFAQSRLEAEGDLLHDDANYGEFFGLFDESLTEETDFVELTDKDFLDEALVEAKNNKDKYTVAYVEVEDPDNPDFYASNGLKKHYTCKGFTTAKAVANRLWNKLNSKKPTAAVFVLPPNGEFNTDSVWAKGVNGKILDKINEHGKNFAESLQESKEEVFVELTDEDFLEESLNEAKKNEDELPPDPEVVKLETHQQLNDLVAGEISTINDYEEVKADIIDKPVEHKDDIIDTINHIEDEEKEHIDELSKTVSEIPFGGSHKEAAPAPVVEEQPEAEEEFVELTDEDLEEAYNDAKHLERLLTDKDFELENPIELGYNYDDEDVIFVGNERYSDTAYYAFFDGDKYSLYSWLEGDDGTDDEGNYYEEFNTLEELNAANSRIKFEEIKFNPNKNESLNKDLDIDNPFELTFEDYNAYGEKLTEAKGDKFTCCICGEESYGYGNNPAPVKEEGRCCDSCNAKFVIPARLNLIRDRKNEELDK